MATTATTTEPLLQGAAAFNATTSRDVKPLLSHLADVGQTPQALFITCSDSRIVPADLVNADPGDIFVLRNIGNIVPTWTRGRLAATTRSARPSSSRWTCSRSTASSSAVTPSAAR